MNKFLPTTIDAASALSIARAHSRFHLLYDEVPFRTALRVNEFCRRENLDYKIAPDRDALQFKIAIKNVNFDTLEKIEQILNSPKPGH